MGEEVSGDPEPLREVLGNNRNENQDSTEDEDYVFAKMVQEQERAFFHAGSLYGFGENGEPELGFALLREMDSQDEGVEAEAQEEDDCVGAGEPSEEDDSVAVVVEDEPVDDETLARRLHLQEQIDHQRRLMELAGINPDEEEYTDDEDEAYLTDDSVDPDEMTYEELRALGDAVGVVSRGLSVDVIQGLPIAAARPGAQEEQCVVCRMEFESGEDVKVLPCEHVFHPHCVDKWLLINKACPICAKDVTVANQDKGMGQAQCDTVPNGQGNKRG